MLLELRIRDFAVIRDLSVELAPGLNVLTGETGAGKSILLGALSLLLGERAASESVRTGAERATIEAVFDLTGQEALQARLVELGFSQEDGLLLLRREVQAEGRNRAWINGSPAAAGTVGEFGRSLVDIHGQHEHQTLLHAENQRRILDEFAEAGELTRRVREGHGRLLELRSDRARREERVRDLTARADFLRFQLQEIEEAQIEEGEDRSVEEELRRLDHAEELTRSANEAHEILYGEDGAASERLDRARSLLERLVRFDASLKPFLEQVETAYHLTTELGRTLGDYAAGVEVEPARAEALRRRADLLFRLKRKYGPELSDVLETRARLSGEVEELEGGEIEMEALERRIAEAEEALASDARDLSRLRTEAASALAEAVEGLLPDLGLPGARFRVTFESLQEPGPGGLERITFEASLNQGFEPRALARIASGGELSRVMLALKSILARVDRVPTLVFDEIDAGIGGVVATAVSRKLKEVAESHQVLVITHLAQLASMGHRHLRVEKETREGLAATLILRLEGEERVREVARMLGGDPESATSREHARELLSAG